MWLTDGVTFAWELSGVPPPPNSSVGFPTGRTNVWLPAAILYLIIGLALVLFTRARGVIKESTADVAPGSTSQWKVILFSTIIHVASISLWPLFLKGWLAEQETVWNALQESPIIQQQKALFDAMILMCEDGVDADEMPNGTGEFGMTSSNPIPCKTVFGSIAYLGRLRTLGGIKVAYERAGSVASDVSPHPVDAYEVLHPDGHKLATLFISPYQKRISCKAPRGFKLGDVSLS